MTSVAVKCTILNRFSDEAFQKLVFVTGNFSFTSSVHPALLRSGLNKTTELKVNFREKYFFLKIFDQKAADCCVQNFSCLNFHGEDFNFLVWAAFS